MEVKMEMKRVTEREMVERDLEETRKERVEGLFIYV